MAVGTMAKLAYREQYDEDFIAIDQTNVINVHIKKNMSSEKNRDTKETLTQDSSKHPDEQYEK